MEPFPETIIASGPVIIENGKVLLNREQKDYGITPWLFPGGKLEYSDEDIELACKREVKEEMGIEIKIIKQLQTITSEQRGKKYVLHHFLAERIGEIKPAEDIVDWGWFDIHNLPQNCAPNVTKIIADLRLQNAE
jgi:ADP-ribose pyrophosphatase YjhB (NUDIX family)